MKTLVIIWTIVALTSLLIVGYIDISIDELAHIKPATVVADTIPSTSPLVVKPAPGNTRPNAQTYNPQIEHYAPTPNQILVKEL